MIFRVILFTLLWAITFSSYASSQDILISSPKEVNAGDDFLVIVSIPSNLMSGIAKLELELPNGFDANVRKAANSEFKYESSIASFRWLNFPGTEEVKISINITTPSNTDGYFILKANAYYLSQNEPVKINIEPQIFTLINLVESNDEMLVINDKTKITFDNFKSEGVACIRQVPYLKNGEVFVNLLVSKGNYNKYGKIQEKIPSGYKVINTNSQNAIFVFNEKQRSIKYMWMNMPDKEKFVVSYKLIPTKDIDESNPFLIFGTFFYADNKITKTVEIKERGIELDEVE